MIEFDENYLEYAHTALKAEIEMDMIYHIGCAVPFTWTGKMTTVGDHVWHEFTIDDGDPLYATLQNDNTGVIVSSWEEALDFFDTYSFIYKVKDNND